MTDGTANTIRGCLPILGTNQQNALELQRTIDDFQRLADGGTRFIAREKRSDLWLSRMAKAPHELCRQEQS